MIPEPFRRAMERKPVYADTDNRPQVTHPESQPPVCHEPLAADEAKGRNPAGDGRIQVQVVSYRRRLLDEDNLCPKFHVDALRYAGLLPDDCPEKVTIQTSQEKVASAADERTEITLILDS